MARRNTRLCELADPDHRDHTPEYRAALLAPPRPPLAGDRVATWAHRTGLDRLAAAWTALTGLGCRCDQRRRLMNRIHAALLAIRRPRRS